MGIFSSRKTDTITEDRITTSSEGLQRLRELRDQSITVAGEIIRVAGDEIDEYEERIGMYQTLINQINKNILITETRAREARRFLECFLEQKNPSNVGEGGTDYDNEHIVPAASESL